MCLIIFWYDDHTLSVITDAAPANQAAEAINQGRSSLDPGWIPGMRWNAVVYGGTVFAMPVQGGGRPSSAAPAPHLSPRETEVLSGLIEGLTIKQIAQRLGLKPRTVTEYTWSVRKKLGAQTREQTVGVAVYLGLVQPKDRAK